LVREVSLSIPSTVEIRSSIEDMYAKRLEELAEISPRAAILEAWLLVEVAAACVQSLKGTGKISYLGPLRLLGGKGRWSPESTSNKDL